MPKNKQVVAMAEGQSRAVVQQLERLETHLHRSVPRILGSEASLDALGRCHEDVLAFFRFSTNLGERVGPSPVRWNRLEDAIEDRHHFADRFDDEVSFIGRDASGYHLLVDTATGRVMQWHHDDDGPLLHRAANLGALLGEVLAAVTSGTAGAPIAAKSPKPPPAPAPTGAHATGPFRLRWHVGTNDQSFAAAIIDGRQVIHPLTFAIEARSLVDGHLLWRRAAGPGRDSVAWAVSTADGVVASVGSGERHHLVALDDGGGERWRRRLPSPGSATVFDGSLWVLAGDGPHASLTRYGADGEPVLSVETPNGGMLMAEADGLVFAADTMATDGLYRFAPLQQTLEHHLTGRVSHLDTDGNFRLVSFFGDSSYRLIDKAGTVCHTFEARSIPFLHDGRITFLQAVGRSRRPTCVDLRTGAPRWVRVPEAPWSPSELCPLGPVVAVDASSAVLFLDPDTGATIGELQQPPRRGRIPPQPLAPKLPRRPRGDQRRCEPLPHGVRPGVTST